MSAEKLITKYYRNISLNVKLAVIFTFIFGFAAHMYMTVNKLPNSDEVYQLVYNMDLTASGRWLLKYASSISSKFSLPWFNSILSFTYIAITAVLIIKILKVKGNITSILIAGMLVTFPAVTQLFPYMQSTDPYYLGLMLTTLGLYISLKYKWGALFAIILHIASLAIYQAYLPLSISLFLIYLVKNILENKMKFKEILLLSLKIFGSILVSIIIYILITKMILASTLVEYQGLDKMGAFSFESIYTGFIKGYQTFFDYFLGDSLLGSENFHLSVFKYIYLFAFILEIFVAISLLRKHKTKMPEALILSFIILVIPLAMSLIFIMAPEASTGLRMLYPYVASYILFILLYELYNKNFCDENLNIKKSIISFSFIIITGIILFFNILIANKSYFAMDLSYKNKVQISNRLLTKIEQTKGYTKNKKIYLVGIGKMYNDFRKNYGPEKIKLLSGVISLDSDYSYYNGMFLKRFMGLTNPVIPINNQKEFKELKLDSVTKKMSEYPNENSIVAKDNHIVVLFSNPWFDFK